MKFSSYSLLVLLATICLLQQSCKKKDPEMLSMSGTMSLTLDSFVEPGYTKTFMIDTLMKASRPDGGTIGYYFYNQDSGVRDTLVTADGKIQNHYYTFKVPETVDGTVTLWLYAFAPKGDNYNVNYATASVVIVRGGLDGKGTITGFDTTVGTTFTDARDGRTYYAIEAGGKTWMRQNLAWKGLGYSYFGYEAMDEVFGRYYTWEDAMHACPDGWHLPSDAEWTALSGFAPDSNIPGLAGRIMGNLYFNGSKLWPYWREVDITDALHLSVMPTGYAVVGEGKAFFTGVSMYAAFWTSDASGTEAIVRYIYQDQDIVYRAPMVMKEFAAAVRCVKD